MKKLYVTPDFEIISVMSDDIITTSPGTETPEIDMGEGSWDW